MTYHSKARKRWRKAEWINGEGRYAVLAWCRVLTVTLWPTVEKAEAAKREIDDTACGGMCEMRHEIVDLDMPNAAGQGR